MKSFIFKIIAILLVLNVSIAYSSIAAKKIIKPSKSNTKHSCFVSGTISDLKGKPFKIIKIKSVYNDNGIMKITEHEVLNNGKYIVEIPKEGFCNLVVSIDSVDKLTIPFFSLSKRAYDLNMNLPTTILPYIDFDDVVFSSKNTNVINYLKDIKAAIYNTTCADLEVRNLSVLNDTNVFISTSTNFAKNAKEIIEKYSNQGEFSLFPFYVCYFNIASNFVLVKNPNLIDKDIVNAFTKKYNVGCDYLHSFAVKWDAVAGALDNQFENIYFQNLLKQNSDFDYLKCDLLYQAVVYYFERNKNEELGYKFYNKLQENYAGKPQALFAKDKYSPNKRIKVGLPIVNFEVKSIDNPNVVFDNTTFLGKYLLIHFWGLGPGDYEELRYVSEAYDDYYDEDFEILTIGLCESLDLLNEYRKEAWTLKWNNGIETKLFAGPIARTFEITQIPFSILVAPDGRIIEVGETLAGRFLNKTLAKYLKKSE